MEIQTSSELLRVLEQRQDFEELLLEISSRFISLPVESIDDAIKDAQCCICKTLNLDLSALWQWSDKNAHVLTITHLHSPSEGPERPVDIDAALTFPWIYQKALCGEVMALSTEQLPAEASLDKENRRFFGVKSSVIIPLQEGGKSIMGVVTFDTLYEERSWSAEDVKRLKLVTEIFSNALARKQSEQKIVESEARLTLAAESAEAGLWEFDCKNNTCWTSERTRQIFKFAPHKELISLKRVEQTVHPEDLEKFRQAISGSFETGEKIEITFRIVTDSGFFAWIYGKGQPFYLDDGSPSRMLGVFVDISERKKLEQDLKNNLAEVKQLKKRLEQENYYLREDLRLEKGFEDIIGKSKEFRAVFTSARQVASTSATVLLLGETGTGKGVMAHAIHQMSDRSDQPFVTVNCAALPNNLIESELFGREKGAFTGAHAKQAGRFEIANRGTIFLDEIGEMGLEMQSKLLRVLQEGVFERLGSPKSVKVDVRIIAATARDLRDSVINGIFREDLFYRINVFPIVIPPLRKRRGDIQLLAQYFVEKYARKMGKDIDSIRKSSLEKILNYQWPGNIRELKHLIERSVIVSSGNSLTLSDNYFDMSLNASTGRNMKDLESVERDHIGDILSQTNWKIEGPGGAASILNIHPSTLRFRLKKLGLERPS